MEGSIYFSQGRAFGPGEHDLVVGAEGFKSFLGLSVPRRSKLQEPALGAGVARGERGLVLVQVADGTEIGRDGVDASVRVPIDDVGRDVPTRLTSDAYRPHALHLGAVFGVHVFLEECGTVGRPVAAYEMEVAFFETDEEGCRVGRRELGRDSMVHLLLQQDLYYSRCDELTVPVLVDEIQSASGLRLIGLICALAAGQPYCNNHGQRPRSSRDQSTYSSLFSFSLSFLGWECTWAGLTACLMLYFPIGVILLVRPRRAPRRILATSLPQTVLRRLDCPGSCGRAPSP